MAYKDKHKPQPKRYDQYDEKLRIARRDLKVLANTDRVIRFVVLNDPTGIDIYGHHADPMHFIHGCCHDGVHHMHPWDRQDHVWHHYEKHHGGRIVSPMDISECAVSVAVSGDGITAEVAKSTSDNGVIDLTVTAGSEEASAEYTVTIELPDDTGTMQTTVVSYGTIDIVTATTEGTV